MLCGAWRRSFRIALKSINLFLEIQFSKTGRGCRKFFYDIHYILSIYFLKVAILIFLIYNGSMAKHDRAVAIHAILEVFNEANNKEAFKRMLYNEAATDIKVFYKEFVVPVMPKDMKLEVEGVLGVADIRSLLGQAVVLDSLEEINAIDVTPGFEEQ
jgi:hypothetical protein